MTGVVYYTLREDEKLPEEFWAIRNVGGEPSEYTFFVPEAKACEELEMVKAENAKLRKSCSELLRLAESHDPEWLHWPEMHEELRDLGVEVD